MKIKIITTSIVLLINALCFAEIPQIALVRPSNNTTQIFTTLQAAYSAALNDDVIYLPGGVYSFTGDSIAKKLHIIGAGFYQDSSIVNGITTISTTQTSLGLVNANGIILEGLNLLVANNNLLQANISCNGLSQITIKECRISGNIVSANNSIISNCVVGDYINACNNSLIQNCIIANGVNVCTNTTIQNCIFLSPPSGCPNLMLSTNSCIVRNCIFPNNCTTSPTSTYQNNLRYNPYTPQPNDYNTILVDSIPQIFVTNMNTISFNPAYDYELKPTCPGNNAGTDGTDIGIYGGQFPCPKGWVPSNPHMYFKQVASQTTPDGKLQIHYKVRKGE